MSRHRPSPPPQPADPDDDARLFRRQAAVDARFHSHRIEPHVRNPKPRPRADRDSMQDAATPAALSTAAAPAAWETDAAPSFCRPGVRAIDARRLKRGQLPVTATIDLHGMTRIEAAHALAAFLHDARRRGHRCVRIIHGKGLGSPDRQPVLKHSVNLWLRQHPDILACCPARAADGGGGAVYALLRRGLGGAQ